MENNIKEFVDLLDKRKDIIKDNIRVSFVLKGTWWYSGLYATVRMGYGDGMTKLIELDDEDIEYFAKKYIPKLEEEMNTKIAKIKADYGK